MIVEGDLDIGYEGKEVFDTWASGEVFLAEVKVGGSVSFGGGHFVHSKVEPLGWGAEWKRALDVDKSEIKGELLSCGMESHGAVILDRAKIGILDLVASHLINPNNIALNALNVSVDRDVVMMPFQGDSPEADGEINFVSARVRKPLPLSITRDSEEKRVRSTDSSRMGSLWETDSPGTTSRSKTVRCLTSVVRWWEASSIRSVVGRAPVNF